jgi:Fe-S-cluster containining protein
MSGRALPVLNFAPFRKYPTRLAEQEFDDDRRVCGSCLSGACCSSEDPIYLTSFDVFRLAAFFDLTPAEFLLKFTQERFDGEDSGRERRPWIEDPDSSKVTYLRRRGSTPKSPCVFLKYVRDEDGTPRRICSVHDARPLSCREFYFSDCKTRQTGELAALLAEGYEKVRGGEITEEMADAQLARFGAHDFSSALAAKSMEYAFWFEMKRVLDMERANVEGGRSYRASDYQDPIDEKLDRVLSAKYLRFEEYYGAEPNGEQLVPYTSGLAFAKSAERARIMKLVRTRPAGGLYTAGDYPFLFGMRTMMPGVRHAEVFSAMPDAEIKSILGATPPVTLFPGHEVTEVRAITRRDVYAAVLNGLNHLIRCSGYLAAMGNVLEGSPPGVIELDLLAMISGLETSRDQFVALEPYLEPVRRHVAEAGVGLLELVAASAKKPSEIFDLHRRLCSVEAAVPALPPDLCGRFGDVAEAVGRKLRKDSLQDYVKLRNPVAARLAAGQSLTAGRAWAAWERSVLDVSYAARAGFDGLDITAYYRGAVGELEEVPFKASYAAGLCRVVVSLARSMSQDNRVACASAPYADAAARLASYGSELLGWLDEKCGIQTLGDELLAGFASYVYGGPGADYSRGRYLGLIIRHLLDSQLPDGSWGTDPPPADALMMTQEDYLSRLYQTTWACVDGLRPVLHDTPEAGTS